jgi:TatD DNase family protein
MLIDIHTHHKSTSTNSISLLDGEQFVGIHPWNIINDSVESDLEKLFNLHRRFEIPLIGETGLDRLKSSVPFDLQLSVFKKHLSLASELNRPLVIHCLKAHSDFLQLLKVEKWQGRFLIHDYSGGEVELKKYLNYDAYFSFGRSLFRDNSKAQAVVKKVPLERLFLETDDSTEYKIEDVYKQAAIILQRDDLEEKILSNFLTFFRYTDHISPTDFIENICRRQS